MFIILKLLYGLEDHGKYCSQMLERQILEAFGKEAEIYDGALYLLTVTKGLLECRPLILTTAFMQEMNLNQN